jgi:para-nitrobenzyl esterase
MNPIKVEQGLLSGAGSVDGSVDGSVHAFKGIPYARPPVGALRWRAPEPPERWDGERDATSFGPACVQPERPENAITFLGHERQSEDCLYLNVWTGAASPSERRPVIVWIHFGAFLMGSGAGFLYDGEALAKAGVVLVTLNHRLGRFGFFAHPELTAEAPYGAAGNYGLLDQIAALRWVQRNIAAFGGDPDCVTLMGQSSGSSSVSLLLASPLAEGLFHRAIAQSGAEFTPPRRNIGWPALSSLADAEQDGVMIGQRLGAPSLAALRAKPATEILGA